MASGVTVIGARRAMNIGTAFAFCLWETESTLRPLAVGLNAAQVARTVSVFRKLSSHRFSAPPQAAFRCGFRSTHILARGIKLWLVVFPAH